MNQRNYFIPISLIVLGLFSSCSGPSEHNMTAVTNNAERNKATALLMQQFVNAHQTDSMANYMAADIVDYGDGSGPPLKTIDEVKGMLNSYFAAFPDVKQENLNAIAEGNQVAVFYDASGTFRGEIMGIKPTGKSFSVKDVDYFKFNDEGKIIEHRSIQLFSTIFQQAGAEMK